jgi:ABC-2 type transport system permease protein
MLFFFQIVLIGVAASFATTDSFEGLARIRLPQFVKMFGMSRATFSGMSIYGYYEPLAVMLVVQLAIFIATEPAGEVDRGLVDLVLARPLPRRHLVTRSIALTIAATVGLMVAMGSGTWIGLTWLSPADAALPSWQTIAMLMIHLTFLAVAFGCVALAAASWSERRGTAQGAVAIVAVGSYLIDIVGEGWARAEPVARLFPFHYYHGNAIIFGSARPILDLSVFVGMAVAAASVAYWQFSRRDL